MGFVVIFSYTHVTYSHIMFLTTDNCLYWGKPQFLHTLRARTVFTLHVCLPQTFATSCLSSRRCCGSEWALENCNSLWLRWNSMLKSSPSTCEALAQPRPSLPPQESPKSPGIYGRTDTGGYHLGICKTRKQGSQTRALCLSHFLNH